MHDFFHAIQLLIATFSDINVHSHNFVKTYQKLSMKIRIHATQWRIIFILSIFCFSTHSIASSKDLQGWTALAASGPINHSRLLFWFDGHARFGDDASALDTSIIRPGLGWQATDDTS